MSKTVHHHDGSRTVTFDDGHKAHFDARRPASHKKISGSPYIFAPGKKITLPEGIAHGMIFEHRNKIYVAFQTKTGFRYGQPITLT